MRAINAEVAKRRAHPRVGRESQVFRLSLKPDQWDHLETLAVESDLSVSNLVGSMLSELIADDMSAEGGR